MIKTSNPELTWRKTAGLVMITLLVSMMLSVWMMAQRISLSSSLFRYTWLFYIVSGLGPAIIVLVLCVLKRPSGSRLWFVLLPMLGGVLFCFYLTLLGPGFYSGIECNSTAYSGFAIHKECVCERSGSSDTSQVKCSLDSLGVSPFARLTEHK